MGNARRRGTGSFFSKGGKRFGVEFKFNEAPRVGKSLRVAMHDLSLSHLSGLSIPAGRDTRLRKILPYSPSPKRISSGRSAAGIDATS